MAASATTLTPDASRELATQLFVLGFPLILMDAVRRVHPVASSRFHRLPPDSSGLARGLTEHDARMVQSSAIIDLADGPAILHVPDVHGRYVSLTLVDAAGEVFASLGNRTREPGGADIAVAGPHWRGEVKRGVHARRAPSDLVWAISRIAANSMADIPAVEALAARQFATSLSAPTPPGISTLMSPLEPMEIPLSQQVAELAPEIFVHRLAQLAERAPAPQASSISPAIAEGLAALRGFDAEHWPEDFRHSTQRGFADALTTIARAADALGRADSAGWQGLMAEGGTSALDRAARAYAYLGASLPQDVLKLSCEQDESGRPLSGDERYRLHFAAGALPPTEAAWRLTLLPSGRLDRDQQPFVSISSFGDLAFNRDGSLDLIIQADPPEPGRVVNWLQPPSGTFSLLAHLYWPAPAALNGTWRMPAVERLGSRYARGTRERPATRPDPSPAPKIRPPGPLDLSLALAFWRNTP